MSDRERWREMNRPTVALETRSKRHNLDQLGGTPKGITTLIPASMYMVVEEDLAAIRRGEGTKLLNNRYEYRGRIYAWEKAATYYPVSGPGFIVVGRGTYRSLLSFKEHRGINARSLHELSQDPYIETADVELAIDVWQQRTFVGDDSLSPEDARMTWRSLPKKKDGIP